VNGTPQCVAHLPVQPINVHAEQHGYHNMPKEERPGPNSNRSTIQPGQRSATPRWSERASKMNFHTNHHSTLHSTRGHFQLPYCNNRSARAREFLQGTSRSFAVVLTTTTIDFYQNLGCLAAALTPVLACVPGRGDDPRR
jgi:hypothetical protein